MSLAPPPYQPISATPDDYIKYLPSIQLPLGDHKYVGLLACQRDPLLQTLTTKIVNSALSIPPPAAKGSKPTKTRRAATDAPVLDSSSSNHVYEVECLDTCLFPEGGGQPSDSGEITVEGETFKVLHVLRRGLKAVHYVSVPEEKKASVEEGKEVFLKVDWEKRMDHMTLHTSQHLLSSLLDKVSLPTLSWSLTPHPAPCYIEIPRAPTLDEITQVEKEANKLIRESTKVWIEVDDQQAQQESEENRKSSRSIPKDYEGGVVRTVCINGVDRNPCCGTHTPSLALLQALHIIPTTTPHSSTTRRLYFVTADRLALYTQKSTLLLSSISSALGNAAPETIPDRVSALIESSKGMDKSLKAIKNELAGLIAKGIEVGESGKWAKVVHRESDEGTTGVDFLGAVSLAVWEGKSMEGREALLVLTATPVPLTATSTSSLHLSGTPAMVSAFGEAVKQAEIFRGRVKGGGAKGKWQAKVEGKLGGEEVAVLEKLVEDMSS